MILHLLNHRVVLNKSLYKQKDITETLKLGSYFIFTSVDFGNEQTILTDTYF